MKLSYILIFSIYIIILNSCLSKRINSKSEKYTSKFRLEAKSVLEASNQFYANLAKMNNSTSSEPKLLENSGWIGMGYNIAYGNPVIAPQDGKLIDAGFTTTLFKQNYTNNNKTPDKTYYFPDGWDVQPAKVCKTNFSSQTIKTVSKLKDTMSVSLGLDVSYGPFSFTANTEYNQMTSSMNTSDKIYISNTATCSVYRAVINNYNPPELSNNFISGLLTLKDKPFKQNEDIYYDFLKNFGTHYIYESMMGSRYNYVLETTNTDYSRMTTSGLKISAEAKYSAIVSVSVKGSYSRDQEKNDTFESKISNKFITSVGAPMPSNLEMEKWLEATVTTPMPISYVVRPITDLLKTPSYKTSLSKIEIDPNILASNIQLAVDNYCVYLVNKKIIKSCEEIKPIKKEEFETPLDEDGNGDLHYLTRHKVECGENSAISGFNLVLAERKYKYVYKCVISDSISDTCFEKTTKVDIVGGVITDSVHFLERLFVGCDDNQAIRSFKLERQAGTTNIYYSYSCCNIKKKKCKISTTIMTRPSIFDTRELNKHEVNTKNNDVLNYFILRAVNRPNPSINYEFNQCTLE